MGEGGSELIQIRGRGAAANPPNRFERLHVEPEPPGEREEEVPLRTEFFRDLSRTIIATNDSPDVGFTHSVNPYRGCENGCAYCLAGDTPILMADGSERPLSELRVGDEILGTERAGWFRRLKRTRVLAHWSTVRPAYRVRLRDGRELICSGDHRFLTERGWKHVTGAGQGALRRPHLTPGNHLLGIGLVETTGLVEERDYERGYLCGMIRGDALLRTYYYERPGRSHGTQHHFRLALVDEEPLERTSLYLRRLGVSVHRFRFAAATATRREITGVRTSAREAVEAIRQAVAWPHVESESWSRGFLAGIYDAEGSYSGGVVRIANTDDDGRRVESVESLGLELPMFDITTGTEDFIANGVVSHNCYARPTHEYLGFSAGLDFESRIMVKADAPALLRAALASPRWKPVPIAMSGVTDPYQPVERRLRITRGCLEVLRDFRNPVGIVTKSHLVTRDVDLLGELAGHGAARVYLSITSLDQRLQKLLEPRAATPRRRLEAVEALARAGVPVGVLVAPVIPGLTDHETPGILAAAAEAGAETAGFIPLRLPGAVAPLFEQWLERHFPDRVGRVLGRVREIRGGRLNDPRFGARMRGEGAYAEQLRALFRVAARRVGLDREAAPLSVAAFRRPDPGGQLGLFDG